MAKAKTGAELRREQIRQKFFAAEDLWTGEKEIGWFPIPRTLPLILGLIDSKPISDGQNASLVYLELLSRMRGDGVIEMAGELDHAFAAGYEGTRALRSWHERMKILEKNRFIRVERAGNETYKYVALIHPTAAVQKLRDEGKVSATWWNAYFARKLDTKELTQEQRLQKQADVAAAAAKVVPFVAPLPFVPALPPLSPAASQPAAAASPLANTGTAQS